MKKTIRMMGLLLVAAGFLFTSCDFLQKAADAAKDETPDLEEELFDASELTEDVDKIELSEGKWIYRSSTKDKDKGTVAQQIDFSVDSSKKVKSGYTYRIYADGEYKEYTPEDMEDKSADDDEYLAAALLSGLQLAAFEMGIKVENGKTNSDKSKFYWTDTNKEGGTNKYWLEKQ